MADGLIAALNSRLNSIEHRLERINGNIGAVYDQVETVNSNVKVVYNELDTLVEEFRDFVHEQMRAGRKQIAHTELVRIRQELEKEFGHYGVVRRTTIGILQADDLGIVKKDTISGATEELMLQTPNYWLSPCLVALAAWISDKPELAERALREGIKRSDEKTSLFFALVCRRAERRGASLKWTQRYLANQDEEDLDRKTVIILDAYASGLLGTDSENVISRQIDEWIDRLSSKPGFIEQQTKQWSDAILLKREPIDDGEYPYLRRASHTWPVLEDVMEGARLHRTMHEYFTDIFEQQHSIESIKDQLDQILTSLVTDFDAEELPLRKEEKLNQLIIDFNGDTDRAQKHMDIEQSAFEMHKDFTQILTDAAMTPESADASVSTQKFAIALSKDWIRDAYSDVAAQNRMKIPTEIEINIDTFNDKTTDGSNEAELLSRFSALVEQEKQTALAGCVMSGFDNFCLPGGATIAAMGALMWLTGSGFLGFIAAVAGIGMVVNHFSKKKAVETGQANINAQFAQKLASGSQMIRATLAEVVDFRAEFKERDGESSRVLDFLDQMKPEQFVKKLSGSGRKIKA